MTVSLNIPDELYRKLEDRARQAGRSTAEQASQFLEQALAEDAAEASLLAEIRREREALAAKGVYVTDEILREAKNWGRE